MLKQIEIKNFRSIRSATADFERLSILVGANGSGKSNLVKGISFITNLSRDGLQKTLNSDEKYRALVPKFIGDIRPDRSSIDIQYTVELPRPPAAPPDHVFLVTHWLSISKSVEADAAVKILGESLEFHNPLLYAYYETYASKRKDRTDLPPSSRIKVTRYAQTPTPSFELDPPAKGELRDSYLDWFGIVTIRDVLTKDYWEETPFEDFLHRLFHISAGTNPNDDAILPILNTFIDPESRSLLTLIPALQVFRNHVSQIEIYDFQQQSLRSRQEYVNSDKLSRDGRYMPSVLRKLKASQNLFAQDEHDLYEMMLKSLQEISTYIRGIDVKVVGTAKEFIEFLEEETKVPVESWEASDGTLRSLAIMLALISQAKGNTIVIEEPEQNLHPWAVRSLLQFIRFVINRREVQVILTTHSQQVLENAYPEEVIFVSRSSASGTTFETLANLPGNTVEMGEVGRLWVKGYLGGVPNYE